MKRRPSVTAKAFALSPAIADRGTSVAQSASASSAGDGWPSTPAASTEANGG